MAISVVDDFDSYSFSMTNFQLELRYVSTILRFRHSYEWKSSMTLRAMSFGGVWIADRVWKTAPGGRTSSGKSLAAVRVQSVTWYAFTQVAWKALFNVSFSGVCVNKCKQLVHAELARCGRSGHVQALLDGVQVASQLSARLPVRTVYASRPSRRTTAPSKVRPAAAYSSCQAHSSMRTAVMRTPWLVRPSGTHLETTRVKMHLFQQYSTHWAH